MRAFLAILVATFIFSVAGHSETVDVGKYEVQGTMRGPEVQFIDSDLLGADAAGKLGQIQLKEMEAELLKHEEPAGVSK